MQKKQEKDAASRPEAKRWIDPAIIERNWLKKEADLNAEDLRRRNAVKFGNERMVSALNKQVAAKANAQRAKKATDDDYSKKYLATANAEVVRAHEEKKRRLQLQIQCKLELEAQMRANAHNRRIAPMSDLEKQVNAPLMQLVQTFETKGQLPLKPYPSEFLPKDLQRTQLVLNDRHAAARLRTARRAQ